LTIVDRRLPVTKHGLRVKTAVTQGGTDYEKARFENPDRQWPITNQERLIDNRQSNIVSSLTLQRGAN
jgi:hypothetical protein